jgi:hypothetical protein
MIQKIIYDEEHRSLRVYHSPDIISVTKLRWKSWVEHVERNREVRHACTQFWSKNWRRRHLGDVDKNGSILLKWMTGTCAYDSEAIY